MSQLIKIKYTFWAAMCQMTRLGSTKDWCTCVGIVFRFPNGWTTGTFNSAGGAKIRRFLIYMEHQLKWKQYKFQII